MQSGFSHGRLISACYGLKTSPAGDNLKPTKIIGEKVSGDRILSDDEMFALWRAAMRTPYPHGPVYQILVLTALRLKRGRGCLVA